MKAKTMMTLVIAIALWASAVVLFAEPPHIDVSLANFLPIPYAYDEVIKLPSGDLQFYKMTPGDGNIQIAGFQYLIQSNTLTDLVQIGSATGFEGIAFREMGVQRFGKFYTIYGSCSIIVGKSFHKVSTTLQDLQSKVVEVFISVSSFEQGFDNVVNRFSLGIGDMFDKPV